LIHQFIC